MHRLLGGYPLPAWPISTIDGVKAADVGWYAESQFASVRGQDAFEQAPEVCVEVISPTNTNSEMRQRKELYFEAGADEVWFCREDGRIEFYASSQPTVPQTTSQRCPNFPSSI